eukprot:6185495-Pleurochrysis_carterae.AAC.2
MKRSGQPQRSPAPPNCIEHLLISLQGAVKPSTIIRLSRLGREVEGIRTSTNSRSCTRVRLAAASSAPARRCEHRAHLCMQSAIMTDAEWHVSEPCAPVSHQRTRHAEWQVGEPCNLSPDSFRPPPSVVYQNSASHAEPYSRSSSCIEPKRQPAHAWVQSKPRSSACKAPSSVSGSITEDSSSVASSKMSISSSQRSTKQTPALRKSSVYRYKEIYGNVPEHPAKRPGYEPPPLAEMPKLKADQIKQSVQRLSSAVPKHHQKPALEPTPKPKSRPASASRANMVPRVATLHQNPKHESGATATCFHAPDFHNLSHSSLAPARTAPSVAQQSSARATTTQGAPSDDRTVRAMWTRGEQQLLGAREAEREPCRCVPCQYRPSEVCLVNVIPTTRRFCVPSSAGRVQAGVFSRSQSRVATKRIVAPRVPQVHELFQEFDTMRTGRLGLRDLREALLRLRLKTNFEEARQILFTYDKDGDGKLNFAEFAFMYKALTTFLAKKGLASE